MNEQTEAKTMQLLAKAKRLAREYYKLTGKPLGVTCEIAEFETARLLKLKLEHARCPGYDATEPNGSRRKRIQIKGRCIYGRYKPGARVGKVRTDQPFDAVLLVLLDENYDATKMYQATKSAIIKALEAPGSKARNERGSLSIHKFIQISRLRWSRDEGQLC